MSFRGKLLVGLISVFCFCLGVTATVLLSPNRSISAAFPQVRSYTFHSRGSGPRWERNNSSSNSSAELYADQEMSRTISSMTGVADEQTLDKLQFQVARLESSGRAYLGVYLRSGNNCAIVKDTGENTPAESAFRRNDAIISIGTFAVTDGDSLRRALLTIEPGVPVTVKYYRNGNLEYTTLTPISQPVGNMPLTHRALGIAYANIGRSSEAAKQFESYRRESPYSNDDR